MFNALSIFWASIYFEEEMENTDSCVKSVKGKNSE